MSFCFNPACPRPVNPAGSRFCQTCGRSLIVANRYRAVRLLGSGVSRTLLGQDLAGKSGHRLCVLQQLGQAAPNDFEQKATVLTELGQHPQLPSLLDHFTNETASELTGATPGAGPLQYLAQEYYLVQEYIAGRSLEELAPDPFSEIQVRQLMAELLPVLRFVHSRQVIHRDIKPANIIAPLLPPDQPNIHLPYALVDFGASKLLGQPSPGQTPDAIGSAGYAAPEQALGQATYASDLYSLGVVCVHLLTGLHPFDLYSVSEDRWIWRQFLPRPISTELRRVLDTLLQRSVSQRYSSAAQVLQALRLEVAVSPLLPLQQPPVAPPRPVQPQASWRCVHTLLGHQGEVTALALSPDGQLIASGSTDKTIRLWNLVTGKLLQTWPGRSFRFPQGHADRITALVFSPNSEVLVSSSADGTIKQWDLVQDELFSTLPSHGWGVSAIALSPISPLLVSGSDDGLIQIWDLESEQLLAHVVQLYQPITALVMDADGQSFWSSSGSSICQWDLSTDRLVKTLKGHAEGVSALALSRGTLISSGGKVLKLWNLSTGEQQKAIAAHRDQISALAVDPTNRIVASGSEDSTVKLWDLGTGRRLATLSHPWGVRTLSFSPDGQLITGSSDETIRSWRELGA